MLSALRSKKNNPIIMAFLVTIILVFIFFFGNQLGTCSSAVTFAAKVNGEPITEREFQNRYSSVFRSYQEQYRQFDRKQAEQMDLKRKVLDQMIVTEILAQKAKERGLAVDDEALRQAIFDNPSFQTNGKFDKDMYERILGASGATAAEFEGQMREQLLAEAMAAVVQNGTYVSTAEMKQAFESEKTQINLEVVRVPFDKFSAKATMPSDSEAEEWLKNTADAEEQITKYYQRHAKTKYNVPKKVRARHILSRFEKGTPPDLKKAATDKIQEAARMVSEGKMTFEEAAKKYSDDSTKEKGGDLGFFSRGQMVSAFEEAAFALKPGEVSNVIETPFGFHIIKVEEVQEPIERKLEDVKQEIAREILREQRAATLAETRAKEIDQAARGGAALADVVKGDADGLMVEETGPFSPGNDYVPRIGVDKAIARAAAKLTAEKPMPEGPMKAEGAWVVFKLKDRTDPKEDEFESAKNQLRPALMFEKRSTLVDAWTESLKAKAKVEVNPIVLLYDEEARAAAQGRRRQ